MRYLILTLFRSLLSSTLSGSLSPTSYITTSTRGAQYLHPRTIQHPIFDTILMLRRLHVVFLLSPTVSGDSLSATLALYIP